VVRWGEERPRKEKRRVEILVQYVSFYAHKEQQTLFAGHTERIVIVLYCEAAVSPKM
jgi:hypothetical protein